MIFHVPCPKEQPRPASGFQCQTTAENSTESTRCKGGKIKLKYKILWTTGNKYLYELVRCGYKIFLYKIQEEERQLFKQVARRKIREIIVQKIFHKQNLLPCTVLVPALPTPSVKNANQQKTEKGAVNNALNPNTQYCTKHCLQLQCIQALIESKNLIYIVYM